MLIEMQILKHVSLLQDFLTLLMCKHASESPIKRGNIVRHPPRPGLDDGAIFIFGRKSGRIGV